MPVQLGETILPTHSKRVQQERCRRWRFCSEKLFFNRTVPDNQLPCRLSLMPLQRDSSNEHPAGAGGASGALWQSRWDTLALSIEIDPVQRDFGGVLFQEHCRERHLKSSLLRLRFNLHPERIARFQWSSRFRSDSDGLQNGFGVG